MTSPVHISEIQADYRDTEKSTAQTVEEMCKLIRRSTQDPLVHDVAMRACWPHPQLPAADNARDTAVRICMWVRGNVRFETDESQVWRLLGRRDELELLISPSVLLRARDPAGDCDDFVMLVCALLAVLGVRPVIKTYKCQADEPWRWSHVAAGAVLEDGSIFPCDASHGDYPGWEVPPQDTYQVQYWDMFGKKPGVQAMRNRGGGLGGYVRSPNWTGSEMTTTRGRVAGPYPSHDVMRAYYPGLRRRPQGLGVLVVDCSGGECNSYDDGTDITGGSPVEATPYYSVAPGTSYSGSPGAAAASPGTVYTPGISTSAPASSINWSSILGQLVGSGTALGKQALATPGTTILPNGTVIAGNPQGMSALAGGIGSSGLLIFGLVAGVVLLFSMAKK